jgi:hypothetical protein
MSLQFSSDQRSLAIQAMDEAEDRTLQYYCIPPYRWQQTNYDLLTSQDHEWEPLPDSALARVQQLQPVKPAGRIPGDFYRIQLNDPGILATARREHLEFDLYPFLVYILTHEMVHLVRLSTIHTKPITALVCSEDEENRVQRIAFRILENSPDRRLLPILLKFCNV